MQHRYKLTISYEGTNYSGWQIQKKSISIQGLIENALSLIMKKKVPLLGASRTDAGVHALGQVAHFSSEDEIDMRKLQASLNGILPKDIRILKVDKVPPTFHARFSAKGKIYHYFLCNNAYENPFSRKYCLHFPHKLNFDSLQKAALLLEGTHDFTSFANNHLCGSAAVCPIKTIKKISIEHLEEGQLRFEFEADGFLYKMIRNMMGTLLEIAKGKREVESIKEILAAKDRKKAGQAAPALGLFLVKVNYESSSTMSSIDSKCKTPLGSAKSICG
jgi:tRNA pseudouridine38-40 synthase